MSDIVERLRGYNPPDRTLDEQRQIAVDIHEAADRIARLEAALREISLMDKVHEHDLFSATCVARTALGEDRT